MGGFLDASANGLATAAILAVAAAGLVLTYTTTGIFNFAHGAIGMLGAFAYWQLRVDWGWPAPLALVAVLGVAAPLLGLGIERLVMRGLDDAPEAARVVVTIGLLAAALGVGLWVWSPDVGRPLPRFWGNESVDVAGVRVTWHDVAALVVAVALAVGLRGLLYRARAGVAMRAAVDDRALTTLNGADPRRSAMLAWAIGCTTAALAGVLVAPSVGLSHVNLTLMIVNAYAAAMIGRLRSLPMTFVGAVLLGLLDAYAIAYLPTDSILLAQFRFAIPVVVLFAVLLALPHTRLRGRSPSVAAADRREEVPRPSRGGSLVVAGVLVALGVAVAQVVSEPDAVTVQRVVAVAIVGLSLVPLVGYAGQLSLCQMSFAGIGALVMAHHGHGGSWVGLALAVVVAALAGAVVALPAVRLAGITLALVTAAFAMLLDQWLFGLQDFSVGPVDVKLFGSGSVAVDDLDVPGVGTEAARVVFLSVVFALLVLLVVGVRRSTFGQRLLALKDSPAACATLGISPARVKLGVFTLSAGIAGLGGALYGGTLGTISPQNFAFVQSLPLLLLGVVGGIAAPVGALLPGVMIGGLPLILEVAPWFEDLNRVLPGTLGITLGRNPNGIVVGTRRRMVAQAAWLRARLPGGAPPAHARVGEAAAAPPPTPSADGVAPDGTPWERVGVERAFTPEDVAALDRALGLEGAR
jgi:branched-chain amino acid transport system permease protein